MTGANETDDEVTRVAEAHRRLSAEFLGKLIREVAEPARLSDAYEEIRQRLSDVNAMEIPPSDIQGYVCALATQVLWERRSSEAAGASLIDDTLRMARSIGFAEPETADAAAALRELSEACMSSTRARGTRHREEARDLDVEAAERVFGWLQALQHPQSCDRKAFVTWLSASAEHVRIFLEATVAVSELRRMR